MGRWGDGEREAGDETGSNGGCRKVGRWGGGGMGRVDKRFDFSALEFVDELLL
jgi:hypothetical protein